MPDAPAPNGPAPETTPPTAPPTEAEARKIAAEADKLAAEARKTNAEADRLARPFYRDPAIFASATPIVLALITLFAGIVSGYFSAERSRLEGATSQLKGDKAQLEGELEKLRGEKKLLEADKAKLEGEKANLLKEIALVPAQGVAVVNAFYDAVRDLQTLADLKRNDFDKLLQKIDSEKGNSQSIRSLVKTIDGDLQKIHNQLSDTQKKIDAMPKFAPPAP